MVRLGREWPARLGLAQQETALDWQARLTAAEHCMVSQRTAWQARQGTA
jgi:hypothetical protein